MSLVVTHALVPAPYGGLETVIELLAHAQASSGNRVTVLAVFSNDPRDHPFWQRLDEDLVNVIPLVVRPRRYLRERALVHDVLRKTGTHVLHTHGFRADVLHAPVARRLGIPTVTTVHGFTGGDLRKRFYEWLQVRSFRHFDAVAAVSGRLRTDLLALGVSPDRLHAVPNAWAASTAPMAKQDARTALGLPREGRRVGWVGRLSREKGPDVMLRALLALGDPDVRLSMIGDGEMRAELVRLASQIGVHDRVDWHGNVPRAAECLTAFDAMAITSWTEGTPMTLFEGLAAGVPVVTTNVGGITDVVSEREAALVQPGDVDGIAAALRVSLGGSSQVAARIRAGRRRLDDFAIEPWIRRYSEIYASCVSGSRDEPRQSR